MSPQNTWQAVGISIIAILTAWFIAGVFEVTRPFEDDSWTVVDDQTDAGQFADAGRADEHSRQEIQVEATVAVPEEVKDAVDEGLTKLGQGIQSLRRTARDAKQLFKWALKAGQKRGRMEAG